ncbi:MAG TPA: dethiobiotin synthase [Gemmataceae bacterium]|nr:dethiobiotin synthase [Gemmataceae bacterium]
MTSIPRGLFVTGTDTGVGKTTVSAALLRHARRVGLRPIPFKPAETGCAPDPADAHLLWAAAQAPVAKAEVCLYAFPLPAAPSQAAAAAGAAIDVDRILDQAGRLASRGDFLLVEGAGGLLVPYAEGVTGADLARRLGLPVLVVARTALGTINHTALTLREAARTGLTVAATILNRTSAALDPHEGGNADLIASLTGSRPLGPFPWMPRGSAEDPDRLADVLESTVGQAALDELLAAR